jgi:hypothetical protein
MLNEISLFFSRVVLWFGSDSVKRYLPMGYGADLTPVVAANQAEASWNACRMAESVWNGLIFLVERNTATGRQDRHPERFPD